LTKVCPNCNTVNPDNSRFCLECGTEINVPSNVKNSNKTSGSGAINWWNKQSKGGKTAIGVVSVCCLGIILIIAIAAMASPDNTSTTPTNTTTTPTTSTPATTDTSTTPTTSSSDSSSSASGIQIKVSSSGSWSGSYGDSSGQQSVDGSGTKTFQMDNPDVVSAVFQKKSDDSGTLTVEILEDGNVVESKSTSAAYGVVSTAHSFY
jgi:hypothetical protein